jgi:hypothetical protein
VSIGVGLRVATVAPSIGSVESILMKEEKRRVGEGGRISHSYWGKEEKRIKRWIKNCKISCTALSILSTYTFRYQINVSISDYKPRAFSGNQRRQRASGTVGAGRHRSRPTFLSSRPVRTSHQRLIFCSDARSGSFFLAVDSL